MQLDPQSKQTLHHQLFQKFETRKAHTSGISCALRPKPHSLCDKLDE
jgi:hypothetical protein